MTASTGGRSWTALIDDMVAGRWINPETGEPGRIPYESVVIADTLDGREAELVAALDTAGPFAVVCDENTEAVMGTRVADALRRLGPVAVVRLDHPHADEATAKDLAERTQGAAMLVAVGSGTINDLCKYVTSRDARSCCVFGTAPSMNGYTSTTASITLDSGLKVSRMAQAPRGVFIDLAVNAAAPTRLIAAGFGDCLVRSVAQFDWWLSHRLLGTYYTDLPFALELPDEAELMARAALLPTGSIEGVGYLHRVLTLCGFGVSFTGITNHGSMGEHQISHYIDCFAGDRHPGTVHGQQVGVATLTMARLQGRLLEMERPPRVNPTRVDEAGMLARYGAEVTEICKAELAHKAMDEAGAEAMNARLDALWPQLRAELAAIHVPAATLRDSLAAAGGATDAAGLGLDPGFYREAVLHAREIRRRYSALDLAADAGFLDDFVAGEG
jgi:glycerol-1-phosphate dehydrogenase [NAD(P)+]